MKPTHVVPRRAARAGRLAGYAAIAAALALAAIPAAGWTQDGPGQYEPSPPPKAGGDDPTGGSGGTGGAGGSGGAGGTFGSAADAASSGTGDSVATDASAGGGAASGAAAATDTVTESSGAGGELPVTGLPAVPLAIAGLLMLAMGGLGLRRLSDGRVPARPDPNDPSGTRRIIGR